jgi:hypothetical protein
MSCKSHPNDSRGKGFEALQRHDRRCQPRIIASGEQILAQQLCPPVSLSDTTLTADGPCMEVEQTVKPQIAYGGLVAGLKAGHISNTWPLMFGAWIPRGMWTVLDSGLMRAVAAPTTVHFIHRWLAFSVLAVRRVSAAHRRGKHREGVSPLGHHVRALAEDRGQRCVHNKAGQRFGCAPYDGGQFLNLAPGNDMYLGNDSPTSRAKPVRTGFRHALTPSARAMSSAVGEKYAITTQCKRPSSCRVKTAIAGDRFADSKWGRTTCLISSAAPSAHMLSPRA